MHRFIKTTIPHPSVTTVLLVDDDVEQLFPLAEALRREGFAAGIATSEEEALFELQASPPDVLVLAETMAARLLRDLRLAYPMPIIVMTTRGHSATLGAPAMTCVEKPVDSRRLVASIATVRRPLVLVAKCGFSRLCEGRP